MVGRAVLACRLEEDQNTQALPVCCGMRDCALCISKQVSSYPHLFHPPLLRNLLCPAVRQPLGGRAGGYQQPSLASCPQLEKEPPKFSSHPLPARGAWS